MVRKALSRIFAAVAISACCMTACSENVEPTPTPPEPSPDFVLEVLDVDLTSVEFSITPADKTMTYVAMIAPKRDVDLFESDQELINDDLAWFTSVAEAEEIPLEDYLLAVMHTDWITDTQDGLDPDTEYCLYAYGMNTEGTPLTKLHKKFFTTKPVDQVELNFEIEAQNITYNSVEVSVKPDSKQKKYFVNVFSEEDYAYWGGDEQAFVNHLLNLRSYYLDRGATIQQMIANLAFVGDKTIAIPELKAGTDYIAYAIGISDDFFANSEATSVTFTTISAKQSDMTFEVEISECDYEHISATITPSSQNEGYICKVAWADELDWYESEESFIDAIVMDLELWGDGIEASLLSGVQNKEFRGLQPLADYVLVCFGWDGAPTTGLHKTFFSTPDATGDPNDLVIDFEIDDLTHNSFSVITKPSVGAYYFVYYENAEVYREKLQSEGSADAAVRALADEGIDFGAEYFNMTRAEYLYELGGSLGTETNTFTQLTPATEYVAYAVAVDIETGELAGTKGFVTEPFSTLEKIYSEAEVEFVYGKYYDGTELANLDPERFLDCTGKALMPYSIVVNEQTMNWYTSIGYGDYTEWECTDDDIYAELITYGYEYDPESVMFNQQDGIARLDYDTPFTFLGIAQDNNGVYGHGTLQVVTLTPDGASPAEEFIASLDRIQDARSRTIKHTPMQSLIRNRDQVRKPAERPAMKQDTAKKPQPKREINRNRFFCI